MYRVDVTPVVGLPQFSGWSQVVSSNFSSSQLVCAFSVSGDHAGNAGRDFTEKISEAEANSPQELNQLVDTLITAAEELDVEIQLACGIFSSNKMILGTTGGSVFLKRGDRTGVLLSSLNQVKIIEGKRKTGDVVALITHQATDFVNEIEQKFISGYDTDSVVTSIIPGLHGLDDSSLSSIAFVVGGREFKEEEEISAEVVEEPVVKAEEESLLDIPPALKLRGAGRNRDTTSPIDFKIDHSKDKDEDGDDQNLSNLGQVQSTKSVSLAATKIWQGLNSVFSRVFTWFKSINWHALLARIVRFLSQLKELFIRGVKLLVAIFRRITAKDIYLKAGSSQKLMRLILPISAGVIIIGGLIGFRVYKIRQQVKNANSVLSPITEQLNSAQGQLEAEPILARESVSQVITQLEQLEKDFADQKKAQQLVMDQLSSARELYDQISGQEEFGQLEIFYDLRLVDSEFLVSSLDATQQQAVFLDAGKKKIITLNLENKQIQQLDLEDVENLVDLELTSTTATVLGQGVLTKDLNDDQKFTEIIAEGDSNRAATLIEGFASYIYLLNPEKRNIYRYSEQKDGYSDPIGWVSGAAGFDYEQVSSWAIDGEMWVATREGGLHKLASGREQELDIVGLAEPFTHSLQVFTHEDLENLYVLEPDGKRLVVLNKKGEFLKEIKSDSLISTTTLFVSEKLGKAFAVSGSIVYAMSI
jgi:hypothetical protein